MQRFLMMALMVLSFNLPDMAVACEGAPKDKPKQTQIKNSAVTHITQKSASDVAVQSAGFQDILERIMLTTR